MTNPDILLAIKPVIKAFDRLSIPYYIGGSVASSVYGMARATMDVDIIADMALAQVPSLVGLLRDEYYIDEQTINRAVSDTSSFNLIPPITNQPLLEGSRIDWLKMIRTPLFFFALLRMSFSANCAGMRRAAGLQSDNGLMSLVS